MRLFVLCLLVIFTGGCALPSSPLETRQRSLTTGQVATVGLGAAAGAIAGKQIGGDTGALIGGATGLVGSALIHNAVAAKAEQDNAERAEQVRREERLKIMQDYWYDQTLAANAGGGPGQISPEPLLRYPAGYYEGVRFAPRLAPGPSLTEPTR